jgi:NADPH:quinone reductase-like Zn-dependent oxidoreductase
MEAPPSTRVELVEKEIPTPGPGEVLIRVEASPCNPSDLMYLLGLYGIPTRYGMAAGFEGCGMVEESGGGFFAGLMKGKRVAFVGAGQGDGCWAEYFVTSAKTCMPIDKAIAAEQAATFIINPFTAFGLLDRAKELGAQAVIQNAAASQVGRLVIRIARMRGIPVISTVRRQEQKDALEAIGAEHVLITTDPDFDNSLKSLAKQLKASVLFDSVSGKDTARLLMAMPARSTAVVYGGLSVDRSDPYGGRYPLGALIFSSAKIEGFWLTRALPALGLRRILSRSKEIQRLLKSGALETSIRSITTIGEYPAAMDAYAAEMSGGKVILKF